MLILNYFAGACYEIKYDDQKSFQGLFIYTDAMQKTFQAWPEFVLIDSTYKLLQLQYPLVITAIVDGNGCTEVIAVSIVVRETEETFRWIIEQLRKHNEANFPSYNKNGYYGNH